MSVRLEITDALLSGSGMSKVALACPHCKEVGLTQKVTALVRSGTTTTWGSGIALGTDGLGGGFGATKTRTELIAGLTLPERPSRPSPPAQSPPVSVAELELGTEPKIGLEPWLCGFFGLLSCIAGFVANKGDSVLAGLVFLVIAVIVYVRRHERIRRFPSERYRILTENARRRRDNERTLREWTEQNERILEEWTLGPLAAWQKEVEAWERATQRWDSLFYCARCDGVFIPGEARFTPVEQYLQALYWSPTQTQLTDTSA